MLRDAAIRTLESILGKEAVFTDPETLLCYAYDATRLQKIPDAVVRPKTSGEIAELLQFANREKIPVIPRGSGTGFVGGTVPVRGGIVLSCQEMDRILEIQEVDFYAAAEPGVVTGDLQKAVEARGLFYPPDPTSLHYCTLGGNIATGAGGARGVKYGTTRDYVLGLEVVLPTGEIIRTGARTTKSVAGYDLTRLMVGSEGTLGVVTKAVLKLIPLPEKVLTLSAVFKDIRDAAAAVYAILRARIAPRVLEFMDRESIRVVENYFPPGLAERAEALLIVETDGDERQAARDLLRIEEICREAAALRIETMKSEEDRRGIWAARRALSPAVYKVSPTKINEDIVVPRSRLPEMIAEIGRIASEFRIRILTFGHAGDGNLHVNIMTDEKRTEEFARARAAVGELFEATLRLGGSLSGEHGIGIAKAPYLPMEAGEAGLAAMRRIKEALDPNGILNPGKIVTGSVAPCGEGRAQYAGTKAK